MLAPGDDSRPVSIRKKVAAASEFDQILGGSDKRDRIQTGIEGAADHTLAPQRRRDGDHGNGRTEQRKRSGHPARQPCASPTGNAMSDRHAI
jgi:hypothetical protein